MAKEYIEREAALEKVIEVKHHDPELSGVVLHRYIKEIDLKDIPAADVVEVRHGRWEAWMPDKNGETREFICTGCRFMVEMSWKQKECDYEWCPYCGCKMDKEETNELD